jgi:outer membrane protein OmpA-like peptidoglycan-associated protein/tetratricopeptide (TPR) repeat protein
MKKLILVVTALITLFSASYAQTEPTEPNRHAILKYPKVKWRKKLKLADNLVKEGSYYNAAEYYQDVLNQKADKIKVMHELGVINQSLRDYVAAEKYYNLVEQKDPKKYPNDLYFLGQMQKMNGKYDDARKTLESYLKSDLGKNDKSYKALAKIAIEGCDSAQAWIASPSKVRIDHEDAINCITTDMSPKPLDGGRIIYGSMASDTATVITGNKKDYYSKIFTARKQDKEWVEITKLPYPPNDEHTHVANAILSDDEKTMYFTKCDQKQIVTMKCKIYRCTKQGADWSNPEEIKALNSPDYTTTQPAFGEDKDGKPILYFVSDRSGKGGLDIFYAPMLDDGKFGPIKNAGPEINTPGDDMTPFYDFKNKVLYFSTDGRPGLGGLDVYKIAGTPEGWDVPVNLGVPVNSQADDIYFALDKTGKKGFVVSNRIGTKTIRGETSGDDIWSISIKEDIVLRGIFVLRTDPDKKPIEGVDASLYHVETPNFEFLNSVTTTKDPFYFTLKRAQSYKINGNKDGYFPSVETVNVLEDEPKDTIDVIIPMDPIIRKPIKVENIYFAFDKSNVIDFYKDKMDSVISVLMQNPGWKVEVQGHTDSKGSEKYNQVLSQKRADQAAGYMVSKGIKKNRITTKGMGKSMPLVPNEKDGQDDPEGRARNRRVEFRLIPDKPDAPEIEYDPSLPVEATHTGPGYEKK